MPREKNTRVLNFKPQYKTFVPQTSEIQGQTNLLHEEIEAIYLMDVLGLYQEDAAKSMEVSRPTFTRIIKNARMKLANGLICGHQINIQDQKQDFIVMFCATEDLDQINPLSPYIYVYHIENETAKLLERFENPANDTDAKPTIALMPLILQYHANYFIADQIGEGFKNSLITKGIQPIIKNSLKEKDLPYILK